MPALVSDIVAVPNSEEGETMADQLTEFLPQELTGGWFKDIIIGRVTDYLRHQWQEVLKAIEAGNLDSLKPIIEQISGVISGALGNRISAAKITAFIEAAGDLWEEWVLSGLIRVGTAPDGTIKAAVIHNDLGSYREDVQAFLFRTAAPDGQPPEFGFMEGIAIIGFIINLYRMYRERRTA